MVKNPPAKWETQVQSMSREDLLEEGMAIHSSVLAWRIGGLQSLRSGRKESDTTERLSTACYRETEVQSALEYWPWCCGQGAQVAYSSGPGDCWICYLGNARKRGRGMFI